jgi:hypothetical protein
MKTKDEALQGVEVFLQAILDRTGDYKLPGNECRLVHYAQYHKNVVRDVLKEPSATDPLRAFVERVAAMRLGHDCCANSCPAIGHNIDPTVLQGVISGARALIKAREEHDQG